MGFISPLEQLAEKFNIINFNIRELIYKLGVWKDTDSDTVSIRLKTQDSPYFENHVIPSMKYIANNGDKKNWGIFKAEGTYYWGSSITDNQYKDEDTKLYTIKIDSSDSPKTHYMEYIGNAIEQDVSVIINNSGGELNSILEFIVTISPSKSNNTAENYIYFIDGETTNVIIKLGKSDLINMTEGQPFNSGRPYPKTFKLSLQYIIKPGNTTGTWILFDLYQFPRNKYSVESNTTQPINQ